MEAIDETLLNDDCDEDLDYDLDPKEENALLQEETDFLEQEFEDEDVLDINVDYDQMDVADDKLDSTSSDKSKSEKNLRRDSGVSVEKRDKVLIFKNDKSEKFKNHSRVHKRGISTFGNRTRRSKTVLINPRFKGPVHVNGRQLAWETPPPILNEVPNNQQYIHPWAAGSISGHTTGQQPGLQMPVNNFNLPSFVPNNSYMYMQQQQQILQPPQQILQPPQQILQPPQQILQPQPQPFPQPQVFMNPLPVMSQPPLLHHNNMVPQHPAVQMDHCTNRFQPPIPQMETIQQVPEVPKLPVHQRLGIPMNNFNQPSNNQANYEDNVHFHNQVAVENNRYNQCSFGQNDQITNDGQVHTSNNQFSTKKFDNQNHLNFNRKQQRKFAGNQGVSNNGNNKVVMSTRKANNNFKTQKSFNAKNSQHHENIHSIRIENSCSSNIVVVPEDEDEETRQYRIKIEEQKRKREEVLRKKEENRLKNLSDVAIDVPTTVVQKSTNHPVRNSPQKNFNYKHRSQQNYQYIKTQVNSNNIVITGNDDQCHFNSRPNKTVGSYNTDFKTPTVRIVTTAGPVSSCNINSKTENTQPFNKEVDTKSLSSFLSNRIVTTQDNLIKTNIVVVKNLATATTKPKIMKLCRGIGTVQKLQMETNERQATIHFDTVVSAHAFYNKYRRYMIDLSMIQVDLVPCEGSS